MTPEKWNEVKEIFNNAVELSTAERGRFLDSKVNGDAELRGEVEKLLASDQHAETLFGKSLIAPKEFSAKDVIGNYRIIKKIGEGGMGAVFLAERADLKQRVALKIIRRGADSEVILKRFRREQEILAALEHPNIARLIDVGVTPDGVPFFRRTRGSSANRSRRLSKSRRTLAAIGMLEKTFRDKKGKIRFCLEKIGGLRGKTGDNLKI